MATEQQVENAAYFLGTEDHELAGFRNQANRPGRSEDEQRDEVIALMKADQQRKTLVRARNGISLVPEGGPSDTKVGDPRLPFLFR